MAVHLITCQILVVAALPIILTTDACIEGDECVSNDVVNVQLLQVGISMQGGKAVGKNLVNTTSRLVEEVTRANLKDEKTPAKLVPNPAAGDTTFSADSNPETSSGQIVPSHPVNKQLSSRTLFVQYGIARSATTLQFMSICVAVALLHEKDGWSVRCRFELPRHWEKEENTIWVIKTHEQSSVRRILDKFPQAVVFVTEGDEQITSMAVYKSPISDLESKGMQQVLSEYASIFRLDAEQHEHYQAYFRYWAILRQCCGSQMSSDWRGFLQGSAQVPKHSKDSLRYPACEVYNISQVESLLMGSYVYRNFKTFRIRHLSSRDRPFNGNYCDRAQRAIAVMKLPFNADLTQDENFVVDSQSGPWFLRSHPKDPTSVLQRLKDDAPWRGRPQSEGGLFF